MLSNVRMRTALAMVGVSGVLLMGMAPVAGAIVITGNTSNVSVSAIDTNRTATLTLHKKAPNPYNTAPVADLPAGTISGVTFSVKRIADVDLGTQAGWDWVAEASVEDVVDGPFSLELTGKTDYEGYVRFSGVPVGVYLVTEEGIDNPSHLYRKSAPFLITVPSGSADGTYWDYDILVNAKDGREVPPTTPPTDPPPPVDPPPPGTTTPQPPPGSSTTTPGVPPPGEPGEPGEPGAPGDTTQPPGRGLTGLPVTGAGVLQAVAVGVALILLGAFLVRRRRQS